MYKNILLTGKSGCGKSTLINRLIEALNLKYSGYRTLQYFINGVEKGYYIHGYVDVSENYSPISIKTGENTASSINETFERFGTEILRKSRKCKESDVIILDEIGVLEDDAVNFKKQLLKTLSHEKLVIGVIKKRDNYFLNQIRHREDSLIINIERYSQSELEVVFKELVIIIEKILDKGEVL